MVYTDKNLTCVECKTSFVFSARDQEFHASKGFANEPKRCTNCRQARRVARGDTPMSAGAGGPARTPVYSGPRAQGGTRSMEVRRGNSGGRGPRRRDESGGLGDGGGRTFGGAGNGNGGAYTGTCAACGSETAVPSDGDARLVLCQSCSNKMAALVSS